MRIKDTCKYAYFWALNAYHMQKAGYAIVCISSICINFSRCIRSVEFFRVFAEGFVGMHITRYPHKKCPTGYPCPNWVSTYCLRIWYCLLVANFRSSTVDVTLILALLNRPLQNAWTEWINAGVIYLQRVLGPYQGTPIIALRIKSHSNIGTQVFFISKALKKFTT